MLSDGFRDGSGFITNEEAGLGPRELRQLQIDIELEYYIEGRRAFGVGSSKSFLDSVSPIQPGAIRLNKHAFNRNRAVEGAERRV